MGLQRLILERMPAGIRAQPFEAMFAGLGILTAVMAAIGLTNSRALQILPPWGIVLWEVCLFTGCGAWLLGLLSARFESRDSTESLVIMRVPIYVFGLTLVCGTSAAYGVSLIILAGLGTSLAAVPWFMLALGSFVRRADLVGRTKGE